MKKLFNILSRPYVALPGAGLTMFYAGKNCAEGDYRMMVAWCGASLGLGLGILVKLAEAKIENRLLRADVESLLDEKDDRWDYVSALVLRIQDLRRQLTALKKSQKPEASTRDDSDPRPQA